MSDSYQIGYMKKDLLKNVFFWTSSKHLWNFEHKVRHEAELFWLIVQKQLKLRTSSSRSIFLSFCSLGQVDCNFWGLSVNTLPKLDKCFTRCPFNGKKGFVHFKKEFKMLLVKRRMKFRSSGWKVSGKMPRLFLSVSASDWKNYFFEKFFQNDPLHSW